MSARAAALLCALSLLASGARASDAPAPNWPGYLDYAYIYSSADPDALRARLAQYGGEIGTPLEEYISEYFETVAPLDSEELEAATRRRAIAYLLDYLASGRPASLERSVEAVRQLEKRLGRFENRYWYHYILAHEALERGRAFAFVEQVLDLWLHVVVPLEGPYDTLETLALDDAPSSGFVSALPYIYENTARLILIRSQQAGLDRDLDPLGAIVRLLQDGRVGGHPDVIPYAASSREYVDRIVARLNGPASDDGSLTFTLALFKAAQLHETARGLLASQGFEGETLAAIRAATGAYETALRRAETAAGAAAVYARVLRQLGEIHAAKQRLAVDPTIETPFTIGGAIDIYAKLSGALRGDGWRNLGYGHVGRDAYLEALRGLWNEIQEASLNAADYYLARSVAEPGSADAHARNAVRIYLRFLSFFAEFAAPASREGLPQSAYFAAFEAHRGVGDAFLAYAASPVRREVQVATEHYRAALDVFPFDRQVWSSLTGALARHGRESGYLALVRPVAERVVRSPVIHNWIEKGEPHADAIAALRRALSDTLVITYMGFGESVDVGELEAELREMKARYDELRARERELVGQRDAILAHSSGQPPAAPAADATGVDSELAPLDLVRVTRELASTQELAAKLERQLEARTRALPLYRDTFAADGLVDALRARRDHPLHALLRRMYYEGRP